ncbi:SDR family oxidoreductase [Rhodococcus opacus]|nr:SDR family oxidoreductase [Rhodococcus opacus]
MTEHEKFSAQPALAAKAVLISGAASGIGRATAERAAASGASVMVADIDADLGAETVARVRSSGGIAEFVRVDVSQADQVANAVRATVDAFGRIDGAHNNAGYPGPAVPLVEYREADWNRLLSVNLTGVFLAMRAQIEVMLEQGSGSIVNTASVAGLVGIPNLAAYAATKHGVIGLTKAAALEVARSGIRVNAVCPGSVDTPLVHKAGAPPGSAKREAAEGRQPMGRLAEPEEIAEAVVWLLSDKASVLTGHPLVVDGGYVAQ